MKKISFIALLFIAFVCLNSCEENILKENGTPSEDLTKLWPAQTDISELWGYINERGEMVIPPTYSYAFGFSCGKAKVYLQDHRVAFIDKTGKIIHTFEKGEECDNFFYYDCLVYGYRDELVRYQATRAMLDANFEEIIPKGPYFYIDPMTKDGLAATDHGYYNKSGRCALNIIGESFCDGVAVISHFNVSSFEISYGAINTKGKLVIDTIYDILCPVGENRLVYGERRDYGRVYGLMDTKGRKITEPIFKEYTFFGDGGLMPVWSPRYGDEDITGTIEGYINIDGEVVLPFNEIYYKPEPFNEGVTWVYKYTDPDASMEEQVYGTLTPELINMQGDVLFSLNEGQSVESNYHNGLCLIHDTNDNSYKYINKQGEVVYRWTPYRGESNAPELQKPARLSEDEMLLKHFEGTEYYPLAEQCVRNKQMRENLKK